MKRSTSLRTDSVVRSGSRRADGPGSPKSSYWRLRPQLLFALGWFLLAAYINSVVQAILQRTEHPVWQTLPDLGFDALRFMPQDAFYADLVLFLVDGLAVARFLLSPRLRYLFLRRRLLTQGAVFLLRAVSIAVTPLPNPYPQCQAAYADRHAGLLALLIMSGLVKTCNDVMFSGHAASMTLSAMFLVWHCDLSWCRAAFGKCLGESWLRPLVIATKSSIALIWIVGLIVVIGTRFHYTLDVFIGAVIAAAVFLHYYALVALVRLLPDEDVEELPDEISFGIIRFVTWFERDAKASTSISNQV